MAQGYIIFTQSCLTASEIVGSPRVHKCFGSVCVFCVFVFMCVCVLYVHKGVCTCVNEYTCGLSSSFILR